RGDAIARLFGAVLFLVGVPPLRRGAWGVAVCVRRVSRRRPRRGAARFARAPGRAGARDFAGARTPSSDRARAPARGKVAAGARSPVALCGVGRTPSAAAGGALSFRGEPDACDGTV